MTDSETPSWKIFGWNVCKNEVVYFCQIIILYTIIIVCIINLTTLNGDAQIWTSLLSACLGYLLPNPSIEQKKIIIHQNCNHI